MGAKLRKSFDIAQVFVRFFLLWHSHALFRLLQAAPLFIRGAAWSAIGKLDLGSVGNLFVLCNLGYGQTGNLVDHGVGHFLEFAVSVSGFEVVD